MPILEFECEECEARFEELVQNPEKAAGISCSRCGSARVLRLFSSFATGGGQSPAPGGKKESPWSGGGGCGCSSGCGCR